MATLPQTRSMHLLPFSSLLSEAGEPIPPLLLESGLPSDCLDDPQSLVPSEGAFRFRALTTQKLGPPDLTLDATRNLEIADLGKFGMALLGAPTLLRLLTEFQNLTNTQTTMAAIQLNQRESGDVSFCHHFHHVPDRGLWESDLYVLQWTIKVVRLVVPDWSPEEIWSLSPAVPGRQRVLEKLGAKSTSFHRDCTGFVIPYELLALPLIRGRVTKEIESINEDQLRASGPAKSFSDSLAQVITTYSNDRWLTINEVAEVLDISARTMQRRLSVDGTTYTDVLERTRSEMAGELLEATDVPIADIARRLGYQNHGNLTRAFKRWSGVSPRVYRQQRQAE